MTRYLLQLAALLLASPAAAVTIEGIRYEGRGCPSGSAAVNVSDDGAAMTVAFDQFYAELTDRVYDLAECSVFLDLKIPAGKQIGLFCVDYRGFAATTYGVKAEFGSYYRFAPDQAFGKIGTAALPDEVNDDFSLFAQIPPSEILWSGCGGRVELELNAKALLYAQHFGRAQPRGWQTLQADEAGVLAVDSVDGEFKMHLGIAQQTCR